jgi:hypothetical protein
MDSNRIESSQTSVEQQSDDTAANHFDHELASSYAANSELSMEIMEEFAMVDRDCIRQIEAKALRKLRHPSRSRKLKAFVEGVKEM